MRAKKDILKKKKTTMRVPASNVDFESDSESYQSSSSNSNSEFLKFSQSEDTPLAVAFENIKKRKKQERADRNTKQRVSQINEGDEVIQEAGRYASETRMFDSFETVSLGRDDSDIVVAEGPVVIQSQPSQKEKEVLQPELEQHEKTNDAEVKVEDAEVVVPPIVKNVVQDEIQPEPLDVIM
ncbi:hypothetical protein PIB30_091170 [Stylosanthes scabra]|uniref:Uncharacterized protein n=1 Tax=Stylosanthes scabra TaxID=79078 RepID=A0ABU6QV90_9FABA|nr:hypothetical protein [Stylosanthes scabra]